MEIENNQLVAIITSIVAFHTQAWKNSPLNFADRHRGMLKLIQKLLCSHKRLFFRDIMNETRDFW
jgi:hypothetical protein